MAQLLQRRTSRRGPWGTTLALLCLLGALLAPVAATAQAPTTTGAAPAAKTATTEPDATDAVTTTAPEPGAAAATPPAAGAATPPDAGAVDPAAPAADPTAVDPAAPATTQPTQTSPPATGGEAAPTSGVVVDEPDDSLPGWVWAAVAVGIVLAALVAWLLVLASGRIERLAPVGHALGEAGWRLSNRWAEFLDWLRFGSGR